MSNTTATPTAETCVDALSIAQFIDTCFTDDAGWLHIASGIARLKDDGIKVDHRGFTPERFDMSVPGNREEAVQRIATLAPTHDVWMAPYPLSGEKRHEETAVSLRRVHTDVDGGGLDLGKVEALGAWFVESGSVGNGHVYVEVDRELTYAEHQGLCRALAAHLGGDSKYRDNDLLRIPGTFNHKSAARGEGDPRPTRFGIEPKGATAHSPEALAQLLGTDLQSAITTAKARSVSTRVRRDSGEWGEVEEMELGAYVTDAWVLKALEWDGDRSGGISYVVNQCVRAGLSLPQTRGIVRRREDFVAKLDGYSHDDVEGCYLRSLNELSDEDHEWREKHIDRRLALTQPADTAVTAPDDASELVTSKVFGDVPDLRKCEAASQLPLTDLGLAERVALHYGDVLAWRPGVKEWMVYNGQVWEASTDAAKALVRRVVRSITNQETVWAESRSKEVKELREKVQRNPDATEFKLELLAAEREARAEHVRYGTRCENGPTSVNSALDALTKILVVAEDQWDHHLLLVNAPNGTYHVGKGVLLDHDPAHRCTMITKVDIDLEATSPDVDKVLRQFDRNREGYAEAILRWSGYSLTGVSDAKTILNIFGPPDIAKSTWFEALHHAVGGNEASSYSYPIEPKTLAVQTGNTGHTADIDALFGKRMGWCDEAEHLYLASDLNKKLSGGSSITTSAKYGKQRSWLPRIKITIAGNGEAKLASHDTALVERMWPMELTAEIPVEEFDSGLKHRVDSTEAGRKAVLAAALLAGTRWYAEYKELEQTTGKKAAKQALHIPDDVDEMKARYAAASNPLEAWFEDRVDVGDEATLDNVGRATTGTWLAYYNTWARSHGNKQMASQEFSKFLAHMGHPVGNPTEFKFKPNGLSGEYHVKGKFRVGMRFRSERDWKMAHEDNWKTRGTEF